MTSSGAGRFPRPLAWLLLPVLVASVLWLRAPTFAFNVWNVDEAIHAAAARTILDGGVLYRDATDLRAPLSYYAVAAIFAVAGENNLAAVRAGIAVLIGATAWLLFLAGARMRGTAAGLAAALGYAVLSTTLLFAGDAFAANTEWFLAFFTAAAAAVFVSGGVRPSPVRLAVCGGLLGLAFLSKQPALLDAAPPVVVLVWLAAQGTLTRRELAARLLAFGAGWLVPVGGTVLYFAAQGALRDLVFYTWTYNLTFYGPVLGVADRAGALLMPFRLLAASAGALLLLWLGGAAVVLHRLLQRQPTPAEAAAAPASLYLAAWSLTALAGAAASGRSFDHYVIQFLPAFALGAGCAVAATVELARTGGRAGGVRAGAALLVLAAAAGLLWPVPGARLRTLPDDPSVRISAYIRAHTTAADRIFVWGFHPDIYLHSDRQPAGRFSFCAFLSGLVPWANTAPGLDTTATIVPGARETLLRELTAHPPAYIVDCSAGPNRFWQKYPLETFPALRDFIRAGYRVVEGGQFVPQGFRLFQRRTANDPAPAADPALPPEVAATLAIGTLGAAVTPVEAVAPNGASFSMVDGHAEYFAHAPSRLVYRIPAGTVALRGGFGLRAAAYAADNRAPTDGAEFIVRWRPDAGPERVLFRRLLQPRTVAADRGVQSFRIELPPGRGGEILLVVEPGPADNPASDWSFWTDLLLETSR